jgi:sRNA-binding protein
MPNDGQGLDNGALIMHNIENTIAALAAKYPETFFVFERRRRPLKVGIRAELMVVCPELRRSIGRALGFYCRNSYYLRAVAAGGVRIGLDGLPAGEVTASEAAWAEEQAAAEEKRQRARRNATARAPRKAPVSAPRAGSPTSRSLGTSLSGLRAAAQERRARSEGQRV